MPVYDLSYQTWDGHRRGPFFRWLAIPRFTYMEFFGNRMFIWLLTIAWFQFLARLVYIYLLVNPEFLKMIQIPLAAMIPVGTSFFKTMVDTQALLCFVFAFFMGSGLISRDLAHNAFVLYASKPISRWEYFIGKFSVPFLLFMTITWLQTALLFAVQTLVSPENSEWRLYFWDRYAGLFVSCTLYSLVISVTLTLLILTASSLTKNNRYAALTFTIYIIGTIVVAKVLVEALDIHNFWAISPLMAGYDLGHYLFHAPAALTNSSMGAAWGSILGHWALCGAILKWQLERAARYGR